MFNNRSTFSSAGKNRYFASEVDEYVRKSSEEYERLLKNFKALDVLPYHTMGVNKYKELGIPYKLDGVPALSKTDAQKAKEYILYGIRKSHQLG